VFIVLAKPFAAWRVWAFLAATILARAKIPTARTISATRGALFPVEALRTTGERTFAARTWRIPTEATRSILVIAARGSFAFAGVSFARTRIGLFVI
jgi:hypothetical protein